MIQGLTRTFLFAAFLVVLSTRAFGGLVHYDFEQPIFTEPPQPVLDHCVVKQDGMYHLFYLRGNPAVNIGHATTTDFVHWTLQPPVLSPGIWDNKALWAPQLYPLSSGHWLMYYTGVNAFNSQQIGFAFSNDLVSWQKWPYPIYRPDTSWAEWTDSSFAHGRDPHVIEDNGHYYLLATAKTNTNRGAVACAVSDDLLNWQDIGPIFVNENWHVLESVFVFRHNNKFQMMFTEEAVNGTSSMSSDSLLSGWDISTRRVIDNGHAPQVTSTEFGEMFSRHAIYNNGHGGQQYVIRFTPLAWVGDIPAVPMPLPLATDWTFPSGDSFYYQPVWGNNAAVRNENYAKTWVGDGWVNTYEYYTGPLGYGFPGANFGESRTGSARSATFAVAGNSMNLLVGGSDLPGQCAVSLYDAATDTVLFSETGRNSNEMDMRQWDLRGLIGRDVYIVMADLSTAGHICVDEIQESYERLPGENGTGKGSNKYQPKVDRPREANDAAAGEMPRLLANVPNPFNPVTTIRYELPRDARVRLDVFDATGALVRTLVDGTRSAGGQRETWSGVDARGQAVSSGVYFSRLTVDGVLIDTRKLVLLK